ncbi:MAG: hypothetical protein GY950_28950, partial [bacterium]|nr:hypothetical protein [bacterium]
MKIARLRYASTVLTLQVLLLPASLLIISVLLFWVTVPITFGHFLLALAVTVGISYLPVKKKKYLAPPANFKKHDFLKITGVFLLLILISLLVSMAVYDFSQDGQAYHQPGIIALANGWNPFHQ